MAETQDEILLTAEVGTFYVTPKMSIIKKELFG